IDIGSAPGGWTSFLASKCRRVLSVDPAELDPAILALPNVVHVSGTGAGRVPPEKRPAGAGGVRGGADLVVSDMNAEPTVV
ncbi:unnamed protein product, partial [Hapterophycus canaliculatus]